ncbi:MAG: GNAT family N-acetyltransferase, partial [Chitinivibrionales bacterium]
MSKENSRLQWWDIERKTPPEVFRILQSEQARRPWASWFLKDFPLSPAHLGSVCRIGFVPFDRCIQDRYYYVDQSRDPEILAAGGISTEIFWDHDPQTLPEGWQGAVRRSYTDRNGQTRGKEPNTMVALLAFTLPRFRGRGLAGKVLDKMCKTAQDRGYRYCLVPALPPAQFEERYVHLTMREIAELTREDGTHYDYWIRLHTRKGATITGFCDHSHRFIFDPADFSTHVSSTPVDGSGDHVVCLD